MILCLLSSPWYCPFGVLVCRCWWAAALKPNSSRATSPWVVQMSVSVGRKARRWPRCRTLQQGNNKSKPVKLNKMCRSPTCPPVQSSSWPQRETSRSNILAGFSSRTNGASFLKRVFAVPQCADEEPTCVVLAKTTLEVCIICTEFSTVCLSRCHRMKSVGACC